MGCGRLDISVSEVSFGGDRNRIKAEVEPGASAYTKGTGMSQGIWGRPCSV